MADGTEDAFKAITKVSQRRFKVEEAKKAKEVFMVGSSTVVRTFLLLLHIAPYSHL